MLGSYMKTINIVPGQFSINDIPKKYKYIKMLFLSIG